MLLGEMRVGKRRVSNNPIKIYISFKATDPFHARDIGLEKLQKFARKEMKAVQATNVAFSDVRVKNGKFIIPLEPAFANRNALYVKSSRKAFGDIVWFENKKKHSTETSVATA